MGEAFKLNTINICSLLYNQNGEWGRWWSLSLGGERSAPARQRQKIEQLSGFRAGLLTPTPFAGEMG